jgi:hypothetical protein
MRMKWGAGARRTLVLLGAVISPSTRAGARSGTLFNHYSLLGTTEQLLHLSKLGQAANYPTMVSAFNL